MEPYVLECEIQLPKWWRLSLHQVLLLGVVELGSRLVVGAVVVVVVVVVGDAGDEFVVVEVRLKRESCWREN